MFMFNVVVFVGIWKTYEQLKDRRDFVHCLSLWIETC